MKTLVSRTMLCLCALSTSMSIATLARAEKGMASFYHDKFHGRTTACGERFSQHKMTAAHKDLPCGAQVKVTRRDNGRSVVVTINDRGPFAKNRVIDLSKAAAQHLSMIKRGLAPVIVSVLK